MDVKYGVKSEIHIQKKYSQSKAMRALTFSEPRTSALPLYRKLKILNLAQFVKVQNCTFVWSVLNKISPMCFHSHFKTITEQHSYGTGQNVNRGLFVAARTTVRYGTYSIKNSCIKNWNEIAAIFGPALVWISVTRLRYYLTSYFLKSYPEG